MDEVIGGIIGATISAIIRAIALILVTYIQSKNTQNSDNNIITPVGYKQHKSKKGIYWFKSIALVLLGGIIGYFIVYTYQNYQARSESNNILSSLRIEQDIQWWAFMPRLLPPDILPEVDNPNNIASELIENATMNGNYKNWPVSPTIRSDEDNTTINIRFTATAIGSNDEWIRINNRIIVSVYFEPVTDHIQLVEQTGAGGGGDYRLASRIVYLSDEFDKVDVNIIFPESDFYTLQPGETEVFDMAFRCKAPGIYQIKLMFTYTYKGSTVTKYFSEIPTVICPYEASYWYWQKHFYLKEEYFWNGFSYTKSQ